MCSATAATRPPANATSLRAWMPCAGSINVAFRISRRSEEHTSELQSHSDLVCRLLLEKKNHSASAKKLKGGLRLDSREGMLKGGDSGAAIVPGKPGERRLVEAIHYENTDLQMPPNEKL